MLVVGDKKTHFLLMNVNYRMDRDICVGSNGTEKVLFRFKDFEYY